MTAAAEAYRFLIGLLAIDLWLTDPDAFPSPGGTSFPPASAPAPCALRYEQTASPVPGDTWFAHATGLPPTITSALTGTNAANNQSLLTQYSPPPGQGQGRACSPINPTTISLWQILAPLTEPPAPMAALELATFHYAPAAIQDTATDSAITLLLNAIDRIHGPGSNHLNLPSSPNTFQWEAFDTHTGFTIGNATAPDIETAIEIVAREYGCLNGSLDAVLI
jgi:hypothetical protein